MTARAARAEAMLRKIGNELRLSEAGKIYLENAIDPFPDSRRQLTGYPDAASGASICPKVKQSITITCPSNITSGTWDLHIFNSPVIVSNANTGMQLMNVVNSTSGSPASAWVAASSPVGFLPNGLCIAALPTGTNLNFASLGNTYPLYTLSIPQLYINDPVRVIASAFEVHNPSAALTKQGSITCYRMPMNTPLYSTVQAVSYNSSSNLSAVSLVHEPMPPINTAAALQLADSVQWEAEKGCYIVHALHDMDIPTDAWNAATPMWYQTGANDAQQFIGGISQALVNGTYTTVTFKNMWSEFDMGGCIITGLDRANTILVNYNLQLELFPGPSSPFVNLADPSPEFDTRALELVSILHREMPVAVTVDRNGFGDWISSAMEVVRDEIAPSVSMMSKMIPGNMGKMIGKGADMLSRKKKVDESHEAEKILKKLSKSQVHPSAGTHGK